MNLYQAIVTIGMVISVVVSVLFLARVVRFDRRSEVNQSGFDFALVLAIFIGLAIIIAARSLLSPNLS